MSLKDHVKKIVENEKLTIKQINSKTLSYVFKKDTLFDEESNVILSCKSKDSQSFLDGVVRSFRIDILNNDSANEATIKYKYNPISLRLKLKYNLTLKNNDVGDIIWSNKKLYFSFNNFYFEREKTVGLSKWTFYNPANEKIATIIWTSGFTDKFKILFEKIPTDFEKLFVVIFIVTEIASGTIIASYPSGGE